MRLLPIYLMLASVLGCPLAQAQMPKQIDSLKRVLILGTDTATLHVLEELTTPMLYSENFEYDSPLSIDNLKSILPQTVKPHQLKVQTLVLLNIGLAFQFKGQSDSGRVYLKKSLALARSLNDSIGQAKALLRLAFKNREIADFKSAIPLLQEAILLTPKTDLLNLRISESLSLSYGGLGRYPEALALLQHSLSKAREIKNLIFEMRSLHYLADLFLAINQVEKSLPYHLAALNIAEKIGDEFHQEWYTNGMGYGYLLLKRYPESLAFYKHAESIGAKIKNYPGLGFDLEGEGEIYTLQKNYTLAELCLRKSLTLARRFESPFLENISLGGLAKLYLNIGNYNQALNRSREAVQLAIVRGDNLILCEQLQTEAQAAAALGLYPEAYAAQKKYISANDSLKVQEINKKLAAQESELAVAQEKENTKQQQLALALAQKTNQQQTQQRNGLLLLVAVVVIAGGFQVRAYVLQRNANKLLAIQKEEILTTNEKLDDRNRKVTESINYAQRIQATLLPPARSLAEALPESAVLYRPRDIVSGDFYWLYRRRDTLLLAVADCTGHGVPGAFMTLLGQTTLNQIVREFGIFEPELLLAELNERMTLLLRQSETLDELAHEGRSLDGLDIALCRLDLKTLGMQFAGANRPLYHLQEGKFTILKGTSRPIGGMAYDGAQPDFERHEFALAQGDAVYLFTDGITDQFGENGRKWGTKHLQETLLANAHLQMREQIAILELTLSAWKGSRPQLDDMLLLGFRA